MVEEQKKSQLTPTRRSALKLAGGAAVAGTLGTVSVAAQEQPRKKWVFQVETPYQIYSSPTIVDGTVFIGCNDSIFALDAETGDKKWDFETGATIYSSPTVVDGTVFAGSRDSNLYALDAETGDGKWSQFMGDDISMSPTVSNGTVFVGADTDFSAIDTQTGEQKWASETEGTNKSSPVVVNGTVFFGSTYPNSQNGYFYALSAETGNERWKFETDSGIDTPTVSDGTVFFCARELYALDAETGDPKWVFEPDIVSFSLGGTPTVLNGTVFVSGGRSIGGIGPTTGRLYAVDAETGEVEWAFATDQPFASSPTVVDDTVFAACGDNNLYAVEGGFEKRAFEFGGVAGVSPTVVDGTIYFAATSAGEVYAFDAEVEGSSEGSRVNLGTLGHHGEWADRASEDNTGSTTVEIRNVDITPDEVDGTNEIHTLSFEVINLSADDGKDYLSIAMPSDVEVINIESIDSGELDPSAPEISPSNSIEFSVDPSVGEISNLPVKFVIKLDLSPVSR